MLERDKATEPRRSSIAGVNGDQASAGRAARSVADSAQFADPFGAVLLIGRQACDYRPNRAGAPLDQRRQKWAQMFSAIVFTYGLLTSFVLSGASRNNRLQKPHPPMLRYIGYVLCGCSAGLSVLLLARVALHYAGFS